MRHIAHQKVRLIVSGVLGLLIAGVAPTAPAGAPANLDSTTPYTVIAVDTGMALGVQGGSCSLEDSTPVVLSPATHDASQAWFFKKQPDGSYAIVAESSSELLTVPHGQNRAGTELFQFHAVPQNTAPQVWHVTTAGTIAYEIHPASSAAYALDADAPATANGVPARLELSKPGATGQQWRITPAGHPIKPVSCNGSSGAAGAAAPLIVPPGGGFVDLHTHPMSNLAFGGKLLYGGVDVGSALPADPDCHQRVRALNIQQALGHDNSTHGGWGTDNGCGDVIRSQVIHALQTANQANDPPDDARGAPDFIDWPRWNDITHQKMWVDWIQRSWKYGLRVIVALAVNNKTMGDAVAGPGDLATDDRASADLQIDETIAFVNRHPDFMQVAYSSADADRIVKSGKLAVVLGIEVDTIGNLNGNSVTQQHVSAEIDRLYAKGVRYIFPIHVIDNAFGGTAVYEGAFNMSNYRESGHFWALECANTNDPKDENAEPITYRYQPDGFDLAVALVKATKLGIDIARNPPDMTDCGNRKDRSTIGHRNSRGLTPLGEFALKAIMRRGMMIDIDHMSQHAMNRALEIAESVPGGYPLNSGHANARDASLPNQSERSPSTEQYGRIGRLHGMAGVGSATLNAVAWVKRYQTVLNAMGPGAVAGFGTDTNGLAKGMPPRIGMRNVLSHIKYDNLFPESTTLNRKWDYDAVGVAHYGMLPDFLIDAETAPGGADVVKNLMQGAPYFVQMWKLCEARSAHIPP